MTEAIQASADNGVVKLRFLFGTEKNTTQIILGLAISAGLAFVSYFIAYWAIGSVFESHLFAKISALICAIAVFFEIGIRKIEKIKPEHKGVLIFLGQYVKVLLPAGDVWVPPFCSFKEIKTGEHMVDMRDTEVYVDQNRKAAIHLQMQVIVVDAYEYALKLASMSKPSDETDPVIEAMIGKVKAAIRIYCETKLKKLQELNEQKENIVGCVTRNDELNNELAKWGIKIKSLIIRTVMLPEALVLAANAVETEEMEKESESRDVKTLVRIGKIIKDGYEEKNEAGTVIEVVPGFGVGGEKLLEASQMQQKRITGTVIRGRGLAVVNEGKS
jgi:regulator of protease activity HflC (stomatin/prohibitin superfamily)